MTCIEILHIFLLTGCDIKLLLCHILKIKINYELQWLFYLNLFPQKQEHKIGVKNLLIVHF